MYNLITTLEGTEYQYHFGNKCVFRLDLKVSTLLEVRSGNLFQRSGTTLQKALSPYVV